MADICWKHWTSTFSDCDLDKKISTEDQATVATETQDYGPQSYKSNLHQ